MSWVEHVRKTRKAGESYKDALKRASATWVKKERVVKKAEKAVKKAVKKIDSEKDLKESKDSDIKLIYEKPKKIRKPRKPRKMKEIKEVVEGATSD